MNSENVFTIFRDDFPVISCSLFSDALVWASVYSKRFPDSRIYLLVSSNLN